MSHKVGDYGGTERPTGPERARLRDLAAGLNPATQRWLTQLGVGPGWHCLEIGAAEGSMSRWLAERTAPGGRVVAADIDTRFLDDVDHPAIEVRELDVRSDALEPAAFDLAYCRTVLLHLPDPEAALAAMRDALRPGGWLFVQEPDMCLCETADPDHPDAERFASFHRTLYETIRASKRFDTRFGRTLPARLERIGLVERGCQANAEFVDGASPTARNLRVMVGEVLGPPLVEAGVLAAGDVERVLALYDDPDFVFLSGVQVGAWGRRPA